MNKHWITEVQLAYRLLSRCKWYEILKKREIKAYISILKLINKEWKTANNADQN